MDKAATEKYNNYLKEGKDGGETQCPEWPEDHNAKVVLLNNGKKAIICLECGYEEVE